MKKLELAVLMGGRGSEREISLMSGKEVIKNLDSDKYKVFGVDWNDDADVILGIKADVVFIVMHGKDGEDGKVQALLDSRGVPYTGSGVSASALGMDKLASREVVGRLGIPLPKLSEEIPCVVKPVDQGSSVGVSIVKSPEKLNEAYQTAKKYSERVMAEEYIEGIEVSCGVLGNNLPEALPVVEIHPKKDFFDYEAKYTEGMSEEIVPARISDEETQLVKDYSVKIFKEFGCRGFARIDFIIRDSKPYFLEINTIPGFTPQSLLPKEALAAGISYPQLLDRIIKLAMEGQGVQIQG